MLNLEHIVIHRGQVLPPLFKGWPKEEGSCKRKYPNFVFLESYTSFKAYSPIQRHVFNAFFYAAI